MTFQTDDNFEPPKGSNSVYHAASARTDKDYLYKYMTLDVFLRCIKSGNILFQEPSEWKDQFENGSTLLITKIIIIQKTNFQSRCLQHV